MFHFPGHNFLGPGTQDFNQQPVDSDDRIAQTHDIAYKSALSRNDIRNADASAIKSFSSDFIKTSNYHSGLGAVGLGAKYAVESLTGVLYPYMSEKRSADSAGLNEEGMDATSSKRSNPAAPVGELLPKPQAGGSVPGGTGSSTDLGYSIETERQPGQHAIFNKTFQLNSAALKLVRLNRNNVTDTNLGALVTANTHIWTTPLMTLNPNIMQLYMSKAEYEALPPWAYATHCEIVVTPSGFKLPFGTNEAATTYANSQTYIKIGWGIGLNNKYNCLLSGIETATDDLVTPTALDDAGFDPNATFYGTDGSIGCNMGVERSFNRYLSIITANFTSPPNLINEICMKNAVDVRGSTIINYKHDFKNGLLKVNANVQQNVISDGLTMPLGFQHNTYGTKSFNRTATATYQPNQEFSTGLQNYPTMAYGDPIEKSVGLIRQLSHMTTPDEPPLVSFGVWPVQSNPFNAATATFANVSFTWDVRTKLHVSYNYNYVGPEWHAPFLKSYDPMWVTDDFGTTNPYYVPWLSSFYISNRRCNANLPNSDGNPLTLPPLLERDDDSAERDIRPVLKHVSLFNK